MDPQVKEFLILLRQSPLFPALVSEIKKHRPTVPNYRWQEDNVAELKARSLEQQGFDKLLNLLTGVSK